MPRVILLKSRSTPFDAYQDVFLKETSLTPEFISILAHRRVNQSQLLDLLANEPHTNFSSLIVTSQRAVEALEDVIKSLTDRQASQLRSMPIYTVGHATAAAIARLQFHHILGAETGNGRALADLILSHIDEDSTILQALRPILFLVGDKRRDIIPKALASHKIPLQEVTVYETTTSQTFTQEFRECLASENDGPIEWIVFFSPMGAEIALRESEILRSKIKIATIGPTTEEYLVKNENCIPNVVAKKPDANSLVEGIVEYSKRSRGG